MAGRNSKLNCFINQQVHTYQVNLCWLTKKGREGKSRFTECSVLNRSVGPCDSKQICHLTCLSLSVET